MEIVAKRLRTLRNGLNISQAKMAPIVGLKQSAINRYENDQAEPSCETLLRYADYFDVSLDYIFGRTDDPQGKLYEYRPKIEESDPEMEKFIEMCFDPSSPMNERLKETLLRMMKGEKYEN
jgi:transcriptional regulator with XRE-family HTH domain